MEYYLAVAVMGVVYILMSASFNIVLGNAGILSFAHVAFFGVGAYAAAILSTRNDLNPWLTPLAAALVSGILGIAVGLTLIRLAGSHMIVVTLGLHVLVAQIALNATGLTGGALGIGGIPTPKLFAIPLDSAGRYLVYEAVFAIPVAALIWWMSRGRWGREVRAARDDEIAAASSGVHPKRRLIEAFGLGAAVAGLAGALYSHYVTFIDSSALTVNLAIMVFVMVVVGGRASFWGGIVGGALMVVIQEALNRLDFVPVASQSAVIASVFAGLLIVSMFLWPRGVLGERWAGRRLHRAVLADRGQATTAAQALLPKSTDRPGGSNLQVNGLSVSLRGRELLRDVSFSVQPGEVLGLVGANGAGKTTLFNALSGFVPLKSGSITLDGRDITSRSPAGRARCGIARSFQDGRLFPNLTVLENVMIAAGNRSISASRFSIRASRSIGAAALSSLRGVDLAEAAEKNPAEVSFGQLKRSAFARLAALSGSVVLLDEIGAGMTPAGLEEMADRVRKLAESGCAVLVIEHDTSYLSRVADRILFMDSGRIVSEGTVADVTSSRKFAEIYFGKQNV